MILKIGDKAPHFEGIDQNGQTITLEQFKGKKLVLYFYPKDNTPGCTAEACNLRDNYKTFLAQGYAVIGVSADSIKSHLNFAQKYQLPFPLISDPDKKILTAYQAYGEKKMYGKVVMGTIRKTYIIDENGIIQDIIEKVDTKNHSEQILK
ncbi:MAG: thioredoxin-dependent thiol peroxidase [Bacteroidales bacterium]|nr:thioredoxin-dependent thiol peroxidase [Bacteroidales bacterium]